MISFSLKLPIIIGVIAVGLYYSEIFKNFSMPRDASKRSSAKAEEQALKKKVELEKAVLKQGNYCSFGPTEIESKSEVVIAEECNTQSPPTCFIIQDDVRRVGGEIVARRFMKIKDSKIIFTVMHLEVPTRLDWDNLKTRNWPVSKLIVPVEYCQFQIGIPFITEALSFESLAKQQVLQIGLGGGSTSSFFSITKELDINIETTVVELDPFVLQMATKYFDHDSTPGSTNVIIRDAVDYLEEAVNEGKTFRTILLDACYSDDETKTGLICPTKQFLTEKVVRTLYDALDDGGVLSINTLSVKDSSVQEKEVLDVYSAIFPSCYLAPYMKARNMIVCSRREGWTWKEQSARFRKNLAYTIERFDFQHLKALYNS